MPVYNICSYLEDAIQSVYGQDYNDWDLVIVDDGSTDSSLQIASLLAKKHDTSIINLKQNTGVTNATHVGIVNARGPVITIVDGDDKLVRTSLSTVLPSFKKNLHLGFVWTQFVKSNGHIGWSRALPKDKTLFEALTNKWWCCSHQRFFRKSYYLKSPQLNNYFRYSSDYQLALLLASTGCETQFIDEVTYWYRVNRYDSISATKRKIQRNDAKSMTKWAKGGFCDLG